MVKKQSINHLSLKPQRKARKPRVPDAHTYSPEARIAKRFRYCRNYAHETQKRHGMDAGARRTAPWTARFDGFVKHRNPKKHNSYSILTVKRSLQESTCATPGARGARTEPQSKKYIIILYYVKPARIRLHLAGHKLLSLSCSDGKLLVFDAHTSPRLDR